MKTNKFFMGLMMAGAVMAGMTACSSDDLLTEEQGQQGSQVKDGEGVYLGLTIKMPSGNGTRSETQVGGGSDAGVEEGTDAENAVSSVYVVLARRSDNGFIAASKVENNMVAIPNANSYKTTAKIQKTNLNDYYGLTGFNREINVFVFCNPTTELSDILAACTLEDTGWLNKTCKVIQSNTNQQEGISIWQPNQFLMNNFKLAPRTLPATIGDWDYYKTENTAFDLSGINAQGQDSEVDNSASAGRGSVEVERSVARFDFKDASPKGNNTYDVVKMKNTTGDAKTLIQVQLQRIMLANEAKEFYYLPRVSNDGLPSNSSLCGLETKTNYVVGPYATVFKNDITSDFSSYFNYTFFDDQVPAGKEDMDYYYNGTTWYSSKIEDVLTNGIQDNYLDKEYRVWRYCTENVIPNEPTNQQKGITTTVIFKGQMLATDECKNSTDKYEQDMWKYLNNVGGILKGDAISDPTLYSINNSLYFTWDNVFQAAIAASVKMDDNGNIMTYEDNGKEVIAYINRSEPLYVAVFGNGGIGSFEYGGKTYNDDAVAVDPNCANVKVNQYNQIRNNPTATEQQKTAALTAMRKAVVGAGFDIYQSSTDGNTKGYYCYYYYYNRHNDNGNNGVMGPMEFAVVRNNVYKLAVTEIKSLGHPRLPDNDPDAPKPDDPDESDNIYLTVTCQVIPWVVRVNNIVFQ